ncbi:hypothetical protein [Pseudomonas aeruginosa]|uniref:hypothetical protein n=1 Tax=Pseudomonas aeruginosa TaxID=287 RepID=UPI00287D0257|nr:hypothetical protein [Pseudomonas aeruginosa]MDS9751441.1 hypothetical protein [Pseudomonas aeruginosa]MDS9771025.1 hypothetical protein [Pseudomonas aeruginosa]MDS9802881.1 hypothetical protein [Pseudomonas aeruginosa]
MGNSLRFMIRWLSYPTIFGGAAAWMIWLLYTGIPYWPSTPIIAALGILLVALLERVQPFRDDWLEDHQDTLVAVFQPGAGCEQRGGLSVANTYALSAAG